MSAGCVEKIYRSARKESTTGSIAETLHEMELAAYANDVRSERLELRVMAHGTAEKDMRQSLVALHRCTADTQRLIEPLSQRVEVLEPEMSSLSRDFAQAWSEGASDASTISLVLNRTGSRRSTPLLEHRFSKRPPYSAFVKRDADAKHG